MLKLIHAMDVNIESVREYYDCFDGLKDLNCFTIVNAKLSPENYFTEISDPDRPLYYLIDDDNPNYIIGFGSIDAFFDCHQYIDVGNIGYGVRPSERCKGYGSEILKLLLLECEKLGMRDVCVSCSPDNVASQKIILKNGGMFEKAFSDDWEGEGLKYWIKLRPRIIVKVLNLFGLK